MLTSVTCTLKIALQTESGVSFHLLFCFATNTKEKRIRLFVLLSGKGVVPCTKAPPAKRQRGPWGIIVTCVMAASCSTLAGYKVGEISQVLHTKAENKAAPDDKLKALFSSAKLFQPEFVAIAPKVRKAVYI